MDVSGIALAATGDDSSADRIECGADVFDVLLSEVSDGALDFLLNCGNDWTP